MDSQRIFQIIFTDKIKNNTDDKCYDIETLSGYIDNTHTLSDRRKIDNHLLNCPLCFENYFFISEQKKKMEQEKVDIPEWLEKRAVKPKRMNLNVNSFFSYISEKWSWFSWGSGFAFGIVIAILLIMFVPAVYSLINTHGEIIAFPPGESGTDTELVFEDPVIHTDLPSAGYHYQKGEEFLSKSLFKEAKEEFIKAVKYNPDYAEAHWHLALLYEKENNYEESLRHWKRFLYLSPKIGSYKEAKEHIQEMNKNSKNE